MASGPETPAVFAAGVPPPRAAGVPRVGADTFVAASLLATAALSLDTPDLGNTVGYTAALETSGRSLSVNRFATLAAPR